MASDITTLKASAATLDAKFDLYATKTEASEYAAAALGNSMAYTDSKIGTATTNITDLTNKVSQLTTNSGNMQSTLTTHTNQISRLATNSGTMNTTLTTHTNQIAQLGAVSATQANQISRLATNSGTMNTTLTTHTNQISQLTTNSGTMASTLSSKISTTDANNAFVHKTGDTMTGVLTMKGNMYEDSYTGALNMANSNIYGLNAIYMADAAENAAEGINFYRDTTHVDTLWMASGKLNFTPNRQLGTNGTTYEVYHTGNLTISNYATYSALNTASGALNTRIATLESHDAMVKQESVTSANYRPLLFSTNYNAAQASIPTTTVTGQTYFNKEIYAQPSTGSLGAKEMVVDQHVTLKYNTSTQALDFIFS